MKNSKILEEVIGLSLPVIGEMVAFNFMIIFDTMILGYKGGDVFISAMGLSREIIETFFGVFICLGLSTATAALVARSSGRRNNKDKINYAVIALKLGIIVSIVISLIFYNFNYEIVTLFKASKAVKANTCTYLKVVSFSLIPWSIINLINSIFRGMGNTLIPFKTSLIMVVTKILFDLIFILGIFLKPMGIMGAAIATSLSKIIACIYILSKTLKIYNVYSILNFKKSIKNMVELVAITIPCFLEEGVFGISRLLCKSMIIKLGSLSFASNEITNMIEKISTMPSSGIAVASTTLVGIFFGSRRPDKIKKYASVCVKFALMFVALFGTISFVLPEKIVPLFVRNKEDALIATTITCLRISAIEQPFIAISNVFSGCLKGLGDAKTPFYISLFSSWVIRIPLMFYFINKLRCSVSYVWWITTIQWVIDGTLMAIFFNRKIKENI